jgi:hypothetical protein
MSFEDSFGGDNSSKLTDTIYDNIREGRLREAIEILEDLRETKDTQEQNVYSVLGYCYYQDQ